MLSSNLPNWKLPPRYQLVNVIGEGTFGSVCVANDLQTGERVAIKEIKNIFLYYRSAKRIVREVCIMRFLNHPSIIKIKKILLPSKVVFNTAYIVMELAYTDLYKLAKQPSPPVYLNQNEVKWLMYQAICGCRYMHSANIFHRDIKTLNILINLDRTLKICDFGLSRSYQDLNSPQNTETSEMEVEEEAGNERDFSRANKKILSDMVGSMYYIAPEMILCVGEYGKEIDVWSLGCVFAELLGMNRDNIPFSERSALFQGPNSYQVPELPPDPSLPNLSVPRRELGDLNVEQWNQICRIIGILGTPSNDDLAFVSNPHTLRYASFFPETEPADLRELFPGSSPDELDLLSKLLIFSPVNRITLDLALEHPYFRDIRRPEFETLATVPADFIFDGAEDLDMQTLKTQFRREVDRYEND